MKKVYLIGLAVLLILLMTIPFSGCGVKGGEVAVISLVGFIESREVGFLRATVTPEKVRSQLRQAEQDALVKAIVLRVESPGGSVAACQEIVAEMERIQKPIVVSMGEMATSGGYFISAKADKIVALPGTLTGSIGVIAQIPNIKGLYDKLGIKVETFTGGRHKDMYFGLRELTEEEREKMQKMTNEYYEQFIKVVVDGRKLPEDKVRELATGELYTGTQAKKLGLVDEIGGLQVAIDIAAKLAGIEKPKIKYYKPKPPSLLDFLFSFDGLSNLIRLKLVGVEGAILLEILNHPYPEPRYQ